MTFLHPLFLWGAVLVSVPLVLHFMLRKKVTVVNFSSLRLLGLLARKSKSNLRLNQWLLLLLRMLLVLILVALFAQPLFKGLLSVFNASSGKMIFIVDNSHSMFLKNTNGFSLKNSDIDTGDPVKNNYTTTIFDRLLQKLKDDIANVDPRTEVTVVFMSPVAKIVSSCEAAAFDSDIFTSRALAKPVMAGPDVKRALFIAKDIFSQASSGDCKIRIYSDFQNNPWSKWLGELSQIERSVTLVPFKGESYFNWAIGRAKVLSPPVVADRTALLQVFLVWSRKVAKLEKTILSLKDSNGAVLATKTIAPPDSRSAFGTVTVNLPLKLSDEGVNKLFLHLYSKNDAIESDNVLSFGTEVVAERTVFLFNGDRQIKAENDELFFLRHVYGRNDSSVSVVEYDQDHVPSLSEMKRAEIIHLAGFPVTSKVLSNNLHSYVEKGGIVVHWAGDQLDLKSINENVLSLFSAYRVYETAERKAAKWLSNNETSIDPAVVFFDTYIRELASVKYFLLEEPDSEDENSTVLAHFEDGTPAVIISKNGKGAFVFINATADNEWSNFPYFPSFPALAASLPTLGTGKVSFIPFGTAFMSPLESSARNQSVGELLKPDGAKILISPSFYDHKVVWTYANTFEPGFYKLSSQNSVNSNRYFVVSPDEKQFKLQAIDLSLLGKGGLAVDFDRMESKAKQLNSLPVMANFFDEFGVKTSDILLLLTSLFLALESIVLWRIEKNVLFRKDDLL